MNKYTMFESMTECCGCNDTATFYIAYPTGVDEGEFVVYHNKCKPKDMKGIAYFMLDDPCRKIAWIVPTTKNAFDRIDLIRPVGESILIWSDFNPDDVEYDIMMEKIEEVKEMNRFYKKKIKESLE